MENTLENKAKFFAQYYGLKCCNYYDFLKRKRTCHVNGFSSHRIYESYLELKPLSSITDEDAIKVARLNPSVEKDGFLIGMSSERAIRFAKNNIYFLQYKTETADYLRSKGYALPYMGLSVENQIEYGWVKLI